MKTIYFNNSPKMGSGCVATIGMFDGVHQGHQLLISMVTEKARVSGLASMVITFDNAPRQVLDPKFRPQLLTTLEEKTEAIKKLGIDQLTVLPFTRETALLPARTFMQKILKEELSVKMLITGYDNHFGHRPIGQSYNEGFNDYVRYGQELDMEVIRGDVELTPDGTRPLSSSVIRKLLAEEGNVGMMSQCLGRYYQLRGKVESGEHIGHRLGFPTANVQPDNPFKVIPASGAYAVWATLGDGQQRAAMMNIGTRPTFDGHNRTLEVNILDFNGDLYGQAVTITFVERLREERRFDSPEALVEQLNEDQEQAKRILL
jgi:riboflavin kinase/FMN adenylyltransferase